MDAKIHLGVEVPSPYVNCSPVVDLAIPNNKMKLVITLSNLSTFEV